MNRQLMRGMKRERRRMMEVKRMSVEMGRMVEGEWRRIMGNMVEWVAR